MAEATTTINVTPKQLGKHLRSIRRKKGLSLSEVARGAGLSRRELVAYERGKLPIPESDLWVLAGSCGVDVAELMPSTPSLELTAAATATSVGDSVSALRRDQEEAGVTAVPPHAPQAPGPPRGQAHPGEGPRSRADRHRARLHAALDRAEAPGSAERLARRGRASPGDDPPAAEHQGPAACTRGRADGSGRRRSRGRRGPARDRARARRAGRTDRRGADAPRRVRSRPPAVRPTDAAPAATADVPVFTEPVQTLPVAPARLPRPARRRAHRRRARPQHRRLRGTRATARAGAAGRPVRPDARRARPPGPVRRPLRRRSRDRTPRGRGRTRRHHDARRRGRCRRGGAAWDAADAPPIDVAMRQGSATWDLGEPPLVAKTAGGSEPATWETGTWQPPAPEGTDGATTALLGGHRRLGAFQRTDGRGVAGRPAHRATV